MSQYISMAEQVRKDFDGSDINGYIKKYASDHNLNQNETQRLVEEVNVGTFLDKLKDGTQHEDFPIAEPTVTHSDGDSPILDSVELSKAASISYDSVSESMFDLSKADIESETGLLQKVASDEINTEVMSSEEKWEEADKLREEVLSDSESGLEKMASEEEVYSALGMLTKFANESEGMVKTAAIVLSLNELDGLAIEMIENSKHSSIDVSESIAEELSKEASEALSGVLTKLSKNVMKDTGEAVKGLAKVVKYPFKHPIVTATGVGGVVYARSDRMDRPDRDRMDMSLRSYKNEN